MWGTLAVFSGFCVCCCVTTRQSWKHIRKSSVMLKGLIDWRCFGKIWGGTSGGVYRNNLDGCLQPRQIYKRRGFIVENLKFIWIQSV